MPKRLRAHSNPLGHALFETPVSPDRVDWSVHYPKYFAPLASSSSASASSTGGSAGSAAAAADAKDSKVVVPTAAGSGKRVTFADVGCGFGGLLIALGKHFPNELSLGLEIRDPVVDIVRGRIQKLRQEHASKPVTSSSGIGEFENVSVVRTNIMKYAPNFFAKGQLTKMFILFADPHFKKSNHRRRVINQNFLALYAYCLAPGGLLYTISDVLELAEWQVQHCTEHPLFERVPHDQLKHDICMTLIAEATEEGVKVTRLKGKKYPAVFRRLANPKPPVTYKAGSGIVEHIDSAEVIAAAATGPGAHNLPTGTSAPPTK